MAKEFKITSLRLADLEKELNYLKLCIRDSLSILHKCAFHKNALLLYTAFAHIASAF